MHSSKQACFLSLPLICMLAAFPQLCETLYTPALPMMARDLHTTAHAIEGTLTTFLLGFAFGVLFWGGVSDYVGRRPALLAGLLLCLVSCLGAAGRSSVEALFFWRFLQAVGVSVGSVINMTMIRDVYHGEERGRIFAFLSGSLAFSPAIGTFIGGYTCGFLGWRANFMGMALLALALALLAFFRLPETRSPQLAPPSGKELLQLAKRLLSSTRLWGHILLIGASNGILFSFCGEGPFVFIDQLNLAPHLYGLLGLVISSSTLIASRVSLHFNGTVPAEQLIQRGAYLTLSGGLSLTVTQAFGYFALTPLGITLITLSLFQLFIGVGCIIPNSLGSALENEQKQIGSAGSIFGMCYYLIVALGTWGMSLLHNGTLWPLPLYLTFLSCILTGASQLIRAPSPFPRRLSPS